MKYICMLMAFAVILAGCGGSVKKTAPNLQQEHNHASHEGHNHDHKSESESAHDHATHDHPAHVHDNGECDGIHQSDNNLQKGAVTSSEIDMDDEIIFPAAQAAKTDFEVQVVKVGEFVDVIKASGRILPAQGDQVQIVAPISGVVSFANNSLTEGRAVGHSQSLFYVSSQKIAQGDILSRNLANYNKAKADFERAEKLIASRIISQREYDDARLVYEQAKIEYQALSGAASSRGVSVSSPIAGYITSLSVGAGDYVEVGQLLGSVSQNRTLTLRADVSMRYVPRLKSITSANFTMPYNNTTYELSKMGGRLLSVSHNAPAGSALIPVTFQLNNVSDIVSGSYVEVSLLGAREQNVISIPLSAITEQQGLFYVYIQLDEEGYARREVKLGADDGLRVRILSGLSAGERVVTRGAINVKMAASSDAIPHGHEH